METIGLRIAHIFVDGFNTWKYNLEEDGETIIFRERQKVDGKFKMVETGRTTLSKQIEAIELTHNIKSIKISERVDIDKDTWKWRTVKLLDTPKMLKEANRQNQEVLDEVEKLQMKINKLKGEVTKRKTYFENSKTLDV